MKSNDPFFGDFFSSFNTVPKVLATLPVEIDVMPLPPGAPASFNGTVGDIKVSSTLDKDSLSVNDALTYRITVSGNGNLKLTSAPRLNISPDIEIYEPKTTSSIKPSVNGASGSVVFEYILIPRYHGSYTIPSFEFTHFDPGAGRYITNTTGEKHFLVTKLDNEEGATEVYGGISKEDIRYLGKDIRHIRTAKPVFRMERAMILEKYHLYLAYGGLLLLFGLIVLVRKEQVRRNSDFARVRNRKAGKVASKRLKRAAAYLKQDNPQQFYSELLKATWGYLGDKLNIPAAELTREKAMAKLKARKMDENVVEMTVELIDICELSRYSLAGNEKSHDEVYKLAVSVIRSIENNI
ncbi:MAG: BatD family protein [Bacteroidales bacterium]